METRRRRTRTRTRVSSEEEIKPKRVRGSRSSSKELSVVETVVRTRKIPTALEAHDYDSTLRLQNYPDFHTLLDSKSLTNLVGACYRAKREQLERMINDPRTTVGELQAIVLSTDAFDSESRSRMKSKEYLDNRLFGKVKDKIEYSGVDGGAIQIEASAKKLDLDDLSDEDLDKLESVVTMLMTKEEEQSTEDK